MPFERTFDTLFAAYGPQDWWPGETPFEVMVGAVLTQNTAWSNVEKAIANLKANDSLSPEAIVAAPREQLAAWLRPSGYFNIKAERLGNYCRWYLAQGGYQSLSALPTEPLRAAVLSVKGVGPETADDILLYAFDRPVFVIDAYTRRIFQRVGLIAGDEPYETLRGLFEQRLAHRSERVALFGEYHALIVNHAKDYCRKRPRCGGCCLQASCSVPEAGERSGRCSLVSE